MGNSNPPKTPKIHLGKKELKDLELILNNYIKNHEEEIIKFFEEKETQSRLLDFGYLDNDLLEIRDVNGPKDYSIAMYMYYDIDQIPINLEIYNLGALLSKSGIIYKILIFNSFFAKILNKSEN